MKKYARTLRGAGHPGLRAKQLVKEAVKRHRMARPTTCQTCSRVPGYGKTGQILLQAHHHKGYEHPLEVQWLCARCHATTHRLSREAKKFATPEATP